MSRRQTVPLLLLLASLTVPLFFRAPVYPHLLAFFRLLSYVLAAFAIALDRDGKTPSFLHRTILGLALVESVMMIVRAPAMGPFSGYLSGNPNYSAVAIGAGLCVLPAVATKVGKRYRRALLGAALVLLYGLIQTQSRSVILGVAVAALILFPSRKTVYGLLGAVAVLAAGLFLFPEKTFPLFKLDMSNPGATFGRVAIWKTAVQAAADRPQGYGLGSFETAYFEHQQPSEQVLRYSRSTAFAHNEFLQVAVEGGWLALLCLLWLIGTFLDRDTRRERDTRWARAIIAMIAVCGFFHFSTYLPANGLLLATALGALARRTGSRPLPLRHVRVIFLGLAAVGLVFLAFASVANRLSASGRLADAKRWMPLRSDLWYEQALAVLRAQGSPDEAALEKAEQLIQTSLALNPGDAFAWHRLALVAQSKGSPDRSLVDHAFESARRLAPKHAPFYLMEGNYRLKTGEMQRALNLFNQAAALEPRAPAPILAMARAYARMGKRTEAESALKRAIHLNERWLPVFYRLEHTSAYARALFDMGDLSQPASPANQ